MVLLINLDNSETEDRKPGKSPVETLNLDYSRVEVAVAARRDGCSRDASLQIHHNKADIVRSARLQGEFGRIILGKIQEEW